MNEKKYTIILADGTEISNLSKNGDNYVSTAPISREIFEDNLSSVTISDGETTVEKENMELVQITQMGEEYWFVLGEITAAELRLRRMESNLEYVAMMGDIEF